MIEFKPLNKSERRELIQALLENAEKNRPLRMRSDTTYDGCGGEITDSEVIDAIHSIPCHYAGMSSLTGTIGTNFKASCSNNITGAVYNPISNSLNIIKTQNVGTAAGNTTTGGGDEVISFQQGIVAGGNATVDLNGLTNLLGQTGVTLARIKAVQIRLLSAADDGTISPAPVATSTIVVTNNAAGMATPNQFIFGNNGSGLTLVATAAAGAITGVTIGAAGTGYPPSAIFNVTVQQAGGSGAVIAVTTNASGVPTSVAVASGGGGAGYTSATLPTVVLGYRYILTGGATAYFDPNANGFCTVSSTNNNIKVLNMDTVNPVTFELDILAAST